eukprot:s1844_g1.t1
MEPLPLDGVQRVEPVAPPEGVAVGDQEDRRHLQEVRVDDQLREPCYEDGELGVVAAEGPSEEHGSHGSYVESPALQRDSTSGGQLPVLAPSAEQPGSGRNGGHGTEEVSATSLRATSKERHDADVGQISRSLTFMTGLLSSLVGRVDRMEQWQSASGSVQGPLPMSTGEGSQATPSAMTPATAPSGPGGQLSLEEVDRLQRQLNQVSLGRREEAGSGHSVEAGRPLASMQKIMAGTFSSDDSETARNRMAEATRGIPGSNSRDSWESDGTFGLVKLAFGAVWRSWIDFRGYERSTWYATSSAGHGIFSYAIASTDYGIFSYAIASTDYGIFSYAIVSADYGVFSYAIASADYGVFSYAIASTDYGVFSYALTSAGYGVPEYVLVSVGNGGAAERAT